jgi:hypothetical protein
MIPDLFREQMRMRAAPSFHGLEGREVLQRLLRQLFCLVHNIEKLARSGWQQ